MPPSHQVHRTRPRLATALMATTIALTGCGVRPEPMTLSENVGRAQADRAVIERAYVPITGPLSLPEALARALKYNYDVQLSKLEATLEDKQLDLAVAAMLPRLSTDAGFTSRSNENAAESIDVRTRQRSLDYSYSEEQSHATADIVFSWNVLDLGISYFAAKQQGFRVLISLERRRKVAEGIVKSVTETYWRAASASKLMPKLDPLLAEAETILAASRKAGERNLQAPAQLLEFQQAMIQVIGELRRMKTDLIAAKIQLASLVNAAPGDRLELSTPASEIRPAFGPTRALEDTALALRPELRVEAYQEKIDRQEIYKEILKMMPGFGILASGNFDSSNLLYRGVWGEVSARATFNLINVINGPRALAAANRTIDIARLRRLALSVAVLTQVNLATQQYLATLDIKRTADQIAAVGKQMSRTASNATTAGSQPESDRVRYELTALLTAYEQDRATASLQTSLADLYTSVGVDLVPVNADLNDLPTLTRQISASLDHWSHGEMPALPPAPVTVADKN